MPFFLLFIIVPILELYAIQAVAGGLGWGVTLVLLFADSLLGAFLVKREGRRAWASFRSAIEHGKWPGDEVAQGGLVLVGGALLLTPGFLTDIVGLAAVLPPTRALIAAVIKRRIVPVPMQVAGSVFGRAKGMHDDARSPGDPSGRGADPSDATDGPKVMDVEVVSVERDDPDELSEG